MKKLNFFILFSLVFTVGFSQTYSGAIGPINDVSANEFNLTVSGLNPSIIDTTNFGLETICINLTHTYDSDLKIELISPDGTMVLLCSGIGGGDDNFTNTCFNDFVTTQIISAVAPFTGTFLPQMDMGYFNNGQNPNGNWILRVTDMAGADVGDLLFWSITFGNTPAQYSSFSSSNMPIVIINTNNQNINQTGKITAQMGIIYNGPGVRNHITDSLNNYNGYIGIEIRGNYSASLPQLPYELETRDSLGNNLDVSLLEMPAENDWDLIAMYNDKSFVRNKLAYDKFLEMGHWGPRSKLCEVVLNGQYQGVYALTESIKRDNNRVNIARLDSTEITWPNVSGGYILKTDYYDNTNSWQLSYSPIDQPGTPIYMVYVYPDKNVLALEQKTYIQNFFNQLESALYNSNFNDTTVGYKKFMSTKSFIDYFIINELSRNNDGFKKSCYYYKEKDLLDGTIGKLKAGPVWDFDWAWKDIPGCQIFQNTDGAGWAHHINDCGPDVYGTGYYIRLLQDSLFANELKCRWTNLRSSILDTTVLFSWVDSIREYSMEAQARHYELWGNMGVATGTPEVGPPAISYYQEVDFFKAWIRRRIIWLDQNMPGSDVDCSSFTTKQSNSGVSDFSGVFPNPFSDQIGIVSNNQNPIVSIEIFNSNSSLVYSSKIPENSINSIIKDERIGALPQGIYFLKVNLKFGSKNFKLVKITAE